MGSLSDALVAAGVARREEPVRFALALLQELGRLTPKGATAAAPLPPVPPNSGKWGGATASRPLLPRKVQNQRE